MAGTGPGAMPGMARGRILAGRAGVPSPAAEPAGGGAGLGARLLDRLQVGYVMLGIFNYSSASFDISGTTDVEIGAVNPLSTMVQFALLLGGLLFVARQPARCLAAAARGWPLILMLVVIAASALWSEVPAATLRRSVSGLALVLYVLSVAASYSLDRFMRLVLLTLVLTAAAGWVLAVLRPSAGFDVGDYSNAVRGLYYQKNAQGMALLGAALALSYLVLRRGAWLWTDMLLVGFILVALVLSRSTTSFLLTNLTFGVTLALLWFERGGRWRAAAVVLGVAAALAALPLLTTVSVSDLLEILGKDASLTGRTYIWDEIRVAISRRPLLGYGYSAFWVSDTYRVLAIQRTVNWKVPNAHSGYLDVMLQLGWLGMALLLTMVSVTLVRVLRALRGPRRVLALWMLNFLAVQATLSNNESTLLLLDLQLALWMLGTMALVEESEAERPPVSLPSPALRLDPPLPGQPVRGLMARVGPHPR
ncbi:O-antigen ligase family protein [Muricoccus radiodurans]|uniref:O-antigen ligase family protein n=1 Tax=Muricoccus radiodurans TaxID=2231721 RepID=UPI003CE9DB6A